MAKVSALPPADTLDGTELSPAVQDGGTVRTTLQAIANLHRAPCDFTVAISDETTAITSGTSKVTFRASRAMTITKIKASLATAGSGSSDFDVNKNGVSVFTTTLTIDASEKTSETAATAAVLSGTTLSLAADDEITIDIDTAGSGAKGAKVTFVGTYA